MGSVTFTLFAKIVRLGLRVCVAADSIESANDEAAERFIVRGERWDEEEIVDELARIVAWEPEW